MKKLMMRSLLCSVLYTTSTQGNFDFGRRFGPDSVIYNTPLYFTARTATKAKRTRKHRLIRDLIKKQIHDKHARHTTEKKI